jgi:hypothetical protein
MEITLTMEHLAKAIVAVFVYVLARVLWKLFKRKSDSQTGNRIRLPIFMQVVFIAGVTIAVFFIFRINQEMTNLSNTGFSTYSSDIWTMGYAILAILGIILAYILFRLIRAPRG